ncbi:hypothetical protein Pve01_01640 [Planomonospora venezuelensis]|nr:hypothetical protein Pve01_01640 [Planomonospora venezuelensis]
MRALPEKITEGSFYITLSNDFWPVAEGKAKTPPAGRAESVFAGGAGFTGPGPRRAIPAAAGGRVVPAADGGQWRATPSARAWAATAAVTAGATRSSNGLGIT